MLLLVEVDEATHAASSSPVPQHGVRGGTLICGEEFMVALVYCRDGSFHDVTCGKCRIRLPMTAFRETNP